MNFKNTKAFTLLELMLVILIIGILTTLAIAKFQVLKEKAIAAEAVRMLGAVKKHMDIASEYGTTNIVTIPGQRTLLSVSTKCWTYIQDFVPMVNPAPMGIRAIRRDGPYKDTYIKLGWMSNAPQDTTWSGTHPGVPQN
ncbi:MAG: type II secretion system protein [Candidatus Omnitrophica bacterium]|nr:type II secretion system protein [Candidatus Omnitrophota bacterium]